jgi:hypothetical protein
LLEGETEKQISDDIEELDFAARWQAKATRYG